MCDINKQTARRHYAALATCTHNTAASLRRTASPAVIKDGFCIFILYMFQNHDFQKFIFLVALYVLQLDFAIFNCFPISFISCSKKIWFCEDFYYVLQTLNLNTEIISRTRLCSEKSDQFLFIYLFFTNDWCSCDFERHQITRATAQMVFRSCSVVLNFSCEAQSLHRALLCLAGCVTHCLLEGAVHLWLI